MHSKAHRSGVENFGLVEKYSISGFLWKRREWRDTLEVSYIIIIVLGHCHRPEPCHQVGQARFDATSTVLVTDLGSYSPGVFGSVGFSFLKCQALPYYFYVPQSISKSDQNFAGPRQLPKVPN